MDPPPDLVIEIERTNPAVTKQPLYARFGIPEVWRYNGERLTIALRRDGLYEDSGRSRAMPMLADADISRLLAAIADLDDAAWLRRRRARALGLPPPPARPDSGGQAR